MLNFRAAAYRCSVGRSMELICRVAFARLKNGCRVGICHAVHLLCYNDDRNYAKQSDILLYCNTFLAARQILGRLHDIFRQDDQSGGQFFGGKGEGSFALCGARWGEQYGKPMSLQANSPPQPLRFFEKKSSKTFIALRVFTRKKGGELCLRPQSVEKVWGNPLIGFPQAPS